MAYVQRHRLSMSEGLYIVKYRKVEREQRLDTKAPSLPRTWNSSSRPITLNVILAPAGLQ